MTKRFFVLMLTGSCLFFGLRTAEVAADDLTSENVVKMLKSLSGSDTGKSNVDSCCRLLYPRAQVAGTQVIVSSSEPWLYSGMNHWEAKAELANTIYHTFNQFPKAEKVTSRFFKKVENEYGEPAGTEDILVLEATRSEYERLRTNGLWKDGPTVGVLGTAQIQKIVDLLEVK